MSFIILRRLQKDVFRRTLLETTYKAIAFQTGLRRTGVNILILLVGYNWTGKSFDLVESQRVGLRSCKNTQGAMKVWHDWLGLSQSSPYFQFVLVKVLQPFVHSVRHLGLYQWSGPLPEIGVDQSWLNRQYSFTEVRNVPIIKPKWESGEPGDLTFHWLKCLSILSILVD